MNPAATIIDPPETALKLVFGSLYMQDLKQCALVSKRWREQINTEVGFKVIVGQSRHPWPNFTEDEQVFDHPLPNRSNNHPIQLITEIGIQSCRIENLKKAEEVLPFKYPLLVKTIILDGKLVSSQWNLLLVPLTNLSTLTISQFALYGLRRKQLNLEFPNLNCLIITGRPPPPSVLMSKMKLKGKLMVGNVIHLLKNVVSPRIKEIVLQKFWVESGKQEDLIVLYLCRFIIRNKATLRKLSVDLQLRHYLDLVNSRLDKSLEAELARLNIGLPGLQLKSMFVQVTIIRSSRTQQMLRLILDSQKLHQLKHVVWKFNMNSVLHGFPNEVVTRNHESLKSIEMSITTMQESINCDAFANCTSLKYLTLIRGRAPQAQAFEGNIGPDGPQLTQTQLLPASLVSIRICGLQVGNEDARSISILNLDVLELENIGDSNGFGLPFTAFQNIIASHNIKLLSLLKCLNKGEGFVGDGAAKIAFDEICSSVCKPFYPAGLKLQLIGQAYSIMETRGVFAESESYYDYGTDPRSTYFKNLTLQIPMTMAERCDFKINLFPFPMAEILSEDSDDDFEEDDNNNDTEVVEEDLSDVDGEVIPIPDEPSSDEDEEEDASDSD